MRRAEIETQTEPIRVSDEESEQPAQASEGLDGAGESESAAGQSRRFWPPTREQLLVWTPFWAVILVGAVLRFWGLGDKPLHHDESLHAYYALQLLHNTVWQWRTCALTTTPGCYAYSPWLHGPFQFHAIALVYQIADWLGAPDHGVNTTTVRIAAATLGTLTVGLPYFLRDYLGRLGAWLACLLMAVSPSLVYFSRFAREDVYFACFTLLMIVATLRYVRDRKLYWLLLAATGFALAYATKETIFLNLAIFGAFTVGLLAWELGLPYALHSRFAGSRLRLPATFAPITVVLYLLVLGVLAKFFFSWLKGLAAYVANPANAGRAGAFVQTLKTITVYLVPVAGLVLGLYILRLLLNEWRGKMRQGTRRGLAARINPRTQRLLDAIVTLHWTSWFFALLLAWAIFLVLYTALFTNVTQGIGDGIWQGLYYWLQQQQQSRGGEPWYYYLLLIPLYEQIGVVFGLLGLLRSLVRPTRFRLFVVVWFLGSLFMYSWAGEKMPWLMIHIVIPMLLLAALALEPCLLLAWGLLRDIGRGLRAWRTRAEATSRNRPARRVVAGGLAWVGSLCALLLLIPTLQNMYQVSYVHAADSQHEMMVYVQTTVYVNTVMDKIAQVDQQVDAGDHQLHIGVMDGVLWPFTWYLRDYPNVCLDYPTTCPTWVGRTPVVIAGDADILGNVTQQLSNYQGQVYVMRGQFDQGYMPPLCQATASSPCDPQVYIGIGPGLWLSYGDNVLPGASFNPVLAFQHIWRWWWWRIPFASNYGGSGGYHMELFIENGIRVVP